MSDKKVTLIGPDDEEHEMSRASALIRLQAGGGWREATGKKKAPAKKKASTKETAEAPSDDVETADAP